MRLTELVEVAASLEQVPEFAFDIAEVVDFAGKEQMPAVVGGPDVFGSEGNVLAEDLSRQPQALVFF